MAENRKVFSKEFKQKAVELSDLRGSTRDVHFPLGFLKSTGVGLRQRPHLILEPGIAPGAEPFGPPICKFLCTAVLPAVRLFLLIFVHFTNLLRHDYHQ